MKTPWERQRDEQQAVAERLTGGVRIEKGPGPLKRFRQMPTWRKVLLGGAVVAGIAFHLPVGLTIMLGAGALFFGSSMHIMAKIASMPDAVARLVTPQRWHPVIEGPGLDALSLALDRRYAMPDKQADIYLGYVNELNRACVAKDREAMHNAVEKARFRPRENDTSPVDRDLRTLFDNVAALENPDPEVVVGMVHRHMHAYDVVAASYAAEGLKMLRARHRGGAAVMAGAGEAQRPPRQWTEAQRHEAERQALGVAGWNTGVAGGGWGAPTAGGEIV